MKTALFNCYFGKLPAYFPLWVQSCAANPEIDFFLITDSEVSENLPHNLKVYKTNWDDFCKKIEERFDFPVSIQSPYKLTDFKPAYGYIFRDLVADYDYWGYCDIDLIFGDVMKFIRKPEEQGIERIYQLGHLSIYRNTEDNRLLFQKPGAAFSYQKVFSTPQFYSFDEHAGQMMLAKKYGLSQYQHEDMADISCRIHRMTASRHKNYRHQVFYYENGSVYRAYLVGDHVETEEFVYIHMQKRNYSFTTPSPQFYILSNRFLPKAPGVPEKDEIKRLSEFVSDETDVQQLKAFRKGKLRSFAKASLKEKRIWLKIKLAERQFR